MEGIDCLSPKGTVNFEECDNVPLNLGDNTEVDSIDLKKPFSFTVVPFKIEDHLEFLEFSTEGHLLLGSSNLVNRNWTGSVWLFNDGDVVPLKEESLCGHGCESGVAAGLFLDNWDKIVFGEDSGKISVFTITKFQDGSTHFLSHKSELQHDGSVTALSVVKDRQSIISGGSDMKINVWDANDLEIQHKYCPAHSMEVTCISTSPEDSTIFASSSLDGLALLWDLKQPKPASAISLQSFGLTSIAWLNDYTVVAGSITGEIYFFDIRNKKEFNRYIYHTQPAHRITVNKELGLVGVCGNSNIIKVWDANTSELIYTSAEHKGLVRGLAWNPLNNKLYSCGFDKRIFSHEIPIAGEN